MSNQDRRQFSTEKKLKAVNEAIAGTQRTEICNQMEINSSTLSKWIKKKRDLEDLFNKYPCGSAMKKKKIFNVKYEAVDKAVYAWFVQQANLGQPLTGALVQEKARVFAERLGIQEFKASKGWLQKWQSRRNIKFEKLRGEAASANVPAAEEFKKTFQETIANHGFTEDEIYNADETGLFYLLLPKGSLRVVGSGASHGRKQRKDRLTINLCSNMSGSNKITPLVIGKSKKPRCFKRISKNQTLKVDYDYSKKAWVTTFIYKRWFEKTFVPEAKKVRHGGKKFEVLNLNSRVLNLSFFSFLNHVEKTLRPY
jgi:hypothetical protein